MFIGTNGIFPVSSLKREFFSFSLLAINASKDLTGRCLFNCRLHFEILEQPFPFPNISNKYVICELSHELANDVRLENLGNQEISEKS